MLLDKDDEMYLSYFWWKPHFKVTSGANMFVSGICILYCIPPKRYCKYFLRPHLDAQRRRFCHLCEKLHADKELKTYEDFKSWLHFEADGYTPICTENRSLLAALAHFLRYRKIFFEETFKHMRDVFHSFLEPKKINHF